MFYDAFAPECMDEMWRTEKGVKVKFTTMSNKSLWRSVEPSIYNRNHVQCGGRNASWLVFVFQRNDTKFMRLVFRCSAQDNLCKQVPCHIHTHPRTHSHIYLNHIQFYENMYSHNSCDDSINPQSSPFGPTKRTARKSKSITILLAQASEHQVK